MLIQGVIFDYENDDQDYRQRFIRAWRMLNKVDSKTLGHKNSIPLEPYPKWVRARAQKLVMPYPSILPVIMEPVVEGDVPYTILHPFGALPQMGTSPLSEISDALSSHASSNQRACLGRRGVSCYSAP